MVLYQEVGRYEHADGADDQAGESWHHEVLLWSDAERMEGVLRIFCVCRRKKRPAVPAFAKMSFQPPGNLDSRLSRHLHRGTASNLERESHVLYFRRGEVPRPSLSHGGLIIPSCKVDQVLGWRELCV